MKAASCSRNIINKPVLFTFIGPSNPVVRASLWPQDCNSGACLRLKDFAQALYLPNLPVSADMFRQKKAQSSEKLPVLPPVSIPRKSPGFTASGCVCNHIKYNSITQSGIILHFQVVTFKSGTESEANKSDHNEVTLFGDNLNADTSASIFVFSNKHAPKIAVQHPN